MNIDFLAGCLTGLFLIPAVSHLLSTGRLDGWAKAPKRKPSPGERVLVWSPESPHCLVATYNGPDGGGDVPDDARLYWRRLPSTPAGFL